MAEDCLRIGLLGCGGIAQFAHLPALRKARRVKLTALCDGAEDLLHAVGRQAGVESLFTDHKALLAEGKIDAVLIATADEHHVSLAAEALRAGKHVLVEKPLGIDSEECEALADQVRSSGLTLQVGNMKRHDPGIAFAREFIRERLGQVLSVSGYYFDSLLRPAMQESLLPPLLQSDQAVRPTRDPKADKQHYSLVTHGAHLMDNLRFLGGEVSALTASHATKFDQHTWHGLLEFGHGAMGHFELTVKINSNWIEGYTVHGEHGSVEVTTYLPFYYRSSDVKAFDARTQQWHTPLGAESNPYKNQLEAFARAVLDGAKVDPGVEDGLADVRLLEAVEHSVATGERVVVG